MRLLSSRRIAGSLGLSVLLGSAACGADTNYWTKATSGYWEEAQWSLGQLPKMDQALVAFRNPGWKALAIGPTTTANFPGSLLIQNLLVQAPMGSSNTLLLNWAGLGVPLVVQFDFTLGLNASLVSHNSALRASNFFASGEATFGDAAIASFERVFLGVTASAALNLTDGSITLGQLNVGQRFPGMVTQTGGTLQGTNLTIPSTNVTQGKYFLSGGNLISSNLSLGNINLFLSGAGHFQQDGGVHSNTFMMLWGDVRGPGVATPFGFYTLNGGVLASDTTTVYAGQFVQNAGSNFINNLNLQAGGKLLLNSGVLVTSNATLDASGSVDEFITQTGGVHTVQNRLRLDGMYVRYALSGGTLVAPNINVGVNAQLRLFGGVISNRDIVAIEGGGSIQAGISPYLQLGKLQITNTPYSAAALDMNPTGPGSNIGPTIIRFRDSRDVSWSGRLNILRWTPAQNSFGAGPDHIFIGTNSQGLTSAQLSQITFVDPGWPSSNYPAVLLANGELIPAVPPSISIASGTNNLILTWSGFYELTSATNVAGPYQPVPGATSPATITFTNPQHFFRLRIASP